MSDIPRYLLVESDVLPEVYVKVVEAKRMLVTGKARSVNEAARLAGISRSAFYKYKDKVHPFNNKAGGRIITLHAMLHDEPGVLSELTGLLYHSGANVLTINQDIPIGGVAPVSVTSRIDGLHISLDELLLNLRSIEGVDNIEIVSGE
jgi:chorismate mutase